MTVPWRIEGINSRVATDDASEWPQLVGRRFPGLGEVRLPLPDRRNFAHSECPGDTLLLSKSITCYEIALR